jgi:hypothetical protein
MAWLMRLIIMRLRAFNKALRGIRDYTEGGAISQTQLKELK